jgi:hypothetical protein
MLKKSKLFILKLQNDINDFLQYNNANDFSKIRFCKNYA